MADRQAFAALLKRKAAPAAEKGFSYTKGQQLSADQVNELLSNKLKWSDYGLKDYNTYGSVDDYAKEIGNFGEADEFGRNASGKTLAPDTFRVTVPDGKGGVKQYTLKANGYNRGGQLTQDGNGNVISPATGPGVDQSKGFTITEGGDGGWEWKTKQDWYNAEAEEQAPSGFDTFMESVIPTVIGAAVGGPLGNAATWGGVGGSIGASVGASAANTFAHGGSLKDFAKNAALGYVGGQVANGISGSAGVQSALGTTGAKLAGGAASGLLSSGGDIRGAVSGAIGTGINMAIPGEGIGYDIARTAARTGVGLLTTGNSGAVGAATNTTGTDTPPAATGWGSTNSRREFADKLIKG